MEHFSDLENQEDSSTKIDSAKKAVQRLKVEIKKINQKQENENTTKINRERERERLIEVQKQQNSFETLKNRLDAMCLLVGTVFGSPNRGYGDLSS